MEGWRRRLFSRVGPRFYRLWYAADWRVRRAIYWLWARLFLIPNLRASGRLHGEVELRCAHTSVVLISSSSTIKAVPNPAATLGREYHNYKKAVETWPVLAEVLLPVVFEKDGMAAYLTSATCSSISGPDAALQRAVALHTVIRTCGQRMGRGFALTQLPQVRCGIDELSKLYGKRVGALLEARLTQFAGRIELDVGFAHGDFHSRNIMVAPDGQPKLIDLDCIRMEGIQQFDALNFVLETQWSRSGKTWAQQIGAYLRNELPVSTQAELLDFEVLCCPDMALAYLVDRVGQEFMNHRFRYLFGDFVDAVSLLEAVPDDRAYRQ